MNHTLAYCVCQLLGPQEHRLVPCDPFFGAYDHDFELSYNFKL
jgi:hypothetical protein